MYNTKALITKINAISWTAYNSVNTTVGGNVPSTAGRAEYHH